ncbi:MAG TPA: hypothetical protein VFG62_12580 [Rhodopila sp.]|nr:hypothetical protein [Rhodopila sp.]
MTRRLAILMALLLWVSPATGQDIRVRTSRDPAGRRCWDSR